MLRLRKKLEKKEEKNNGGICFSSSSIRTLKKIEAAHKLRSNCYLCGKGGENNPDLIYSC